MEAGRAAVQLCKPGITAFLVLSALVAMRLAGPVRLESLAPWVLALAVAATVGGAAALNQIREWALDARMTRTRSRPLPSGRISRGAALVVAVGLSATGLGLSAVLLPWPATTFLLLGHAGYVLVYTPMKRRSAHATGVGALVGAMPVLTGAAAADGRLATPALLLYAVVVLWQIPHFMAIGWLHRRDYAAAGFRVLPAVDSAGRRTAWVSVVAALATSVPAVLAVTMTAGTSVGFMVAVAGVGGVYLERAVAFLRARDRDTARRLFLTSLVYLPVYLTALVASTFA